MKILETERLYLREFEQNDLDALAGIYSDETVMKYIGKGGAIDKKNTELIINAWKNKLYKEYGYGIWALIYKANGLLIGHCGFKHLKEISEIEIAYLLCKDFWGKGLATEISKATLDFGFSHLNFKKVIAMAYEENSASVNVLKKIGMKYDGKKVFFGKELEFFSLTDIAFKNLQNKK